MAAPLKDFRGKVTAETDCVLDAVARTSGKDKAEIAREILHDWALMRIAEHSLLGPLLRAEGLAGEDGRIVGTSRRGRSV
jgi:hypothetical protein